MRHLQGPGGDNIINAEFNKRWPNDIEFVIESIKGVFDLSSCIK